MCLTYLAAQYVNTFCLIERIMENAHYFITFIFGCKIMQKVKIRILTNL